MSAAPSNPAAPDAHTIGKSGQDVTDPSAPQGDNSLVSSSIESVQSPLLKSSAEEPARRSINLERQAVIIRSESARQSQNSAFVSRRVASGVALTPSVQPNPKHPPLNLHQLQLHQLDNHRLEQLGQVMPLQKRLHCLQRGQTLS
jgi:hypothetical protein